MNSALYYKRLKRYFLDGFLHFFHPLTLAKPQQMNFSSDNFFRDKVMCLNPAARNEQVL